MPAPNGSWRGPPIAIIIIFAIAKLTARMGRLRGRRICLTLEIIKFTRGGVRVPARQLSRNIRSFTRMESLKFLSIRPETAARSEERRVGKECSTRWSRYSGEEQKQSDIRILPRQKATRRE